MSGFKGKINILMISLASLWTPYWLTEAVKAESSLPVHHRQIQVTMTNNVGIDNVINNHQEKNPVSVVEVPILMANSPPPTIITPPKPLTPQPSTTPQPLPPPAELLQPSTPTPQAPDNYPSNVQGAITIKQFNFKGNTAFSSERLRKELSNFTNRPLTFGELLQARSKITDLYIKNGYQTSGALIPPQTLDGGVVTIQIVEGKLEEIKVNYTEKSSHRLNPNYVRSRIGVATAGALNVPRLLEGLRLLQLDPLIANLSAELAAGSKPGTSLLTVTITEANTFSTQLSYNNSRSPSVGSIRRGIQAKQANLLGLGDSITVGYGNTDASDAFDISYNLPINGHNGTLNISYGNTSSNVIETPFNALDIRASSRYFDLTLRQPLIQSPSQEFAIGLTASRRETDTSFLKNVIGESLPFPSPGSDDKGRTRLSALRFFQDWTQRGAKQVISARSQFSVGIDAFNATVNNNPPDTRFFSWRGQAQWVRLLAADTLMLVRGDIQFSNQSILPIEQYGLGGQDTLRGYRQDTLLTDNGANLSAELRIPVLRFAKAGLLQVAPFVDVGRGWNNQNSDPNPATLASVGLGLQLNLANSLTARFDWGIPLVSVDSSKRTWQENGLHFSILFNPF